MVRIMVRRRQSLWRATRYVPMACNDALSMLAVSLAEQRRRVLIVSPTKPSVAMAATIWRKPGAIQWHKDTSRETDLASLAFEFRRDRRPGRAVAVQPKPPAPYLVVNDLNYFFGDPADGSLNELALNKSSRCIAEVEEVLQSSGGECIVGATTAGDDSLVAKWIAEQGWADGSTSLATDMADTRSCPMRSWIHNADKEPPLEFPYGPLEGNKKQVASWISADRKPDHRRLEAPAKYGTIWVRQTGRYSVAVWFRSAQKYAEANQRRVEAEVGTRRA